MFSECQTDFTQDRYVVWWNQNFKNGYNPILLLYSASQVDDIA